MAVQLRAALERQGMRAVLTREAAANPGFDDRATLANSYRGAVLIALHASSVGSPGTVRAYYDAVAPLAFRPLAGAAGSEENAAPRSSLVRWEEAQQPHISASKRLAEMIQSRLRERFSGSPAAASSATLRDLRSVAGPAVAVEVASVSVADKKALDQMIPGVAEAIARAIAAFREAESAAGSL
jgi:N-acetylmuramoyl-L-alanine amidase